MMSSSRGAIQNKTAHWRSLDRLLQGKGTARKRQRAAESPDHRDLRLERQLEYKSRGLTVVHMYCS